MFRPSSWLRNGTFVFIQCRRRVLLKRESLEYKFRHKISIMEGKQRIHQERNQHQTFQLTREKNKILICCKFNTRNSFAYLTTPTECPTFVTSSSLTSIPGKFGSWLEYFNRRRITLPSATINRRYQLDDNKVCSPIQDFLMGNRFAAFFAFSLLPLRLWQIKKYSFQPVYRVHNG